MKKCLLGCALFSTLATAQSLPSFQIQLAEQSFPGAVTGRLLVYLGKGEDEPRFGPHWLDPQPIFSIWVKDVEASAVLRLDPAQSVHFPRDLSKIAPGEYLAQAVLDRNLGGRAIGASPGNVYSKPLKIVIGKTSELVTLRCDQIVEEPLKRSTPVCVLFEMQSKLLSAFYGRPTKLKAAVWLPKAWSDYPTKRFPVYYEVHGFGGSAYGALGQASPTPSIDGVPFIKVYLDANCPTGHSVFADSDNNGPWGKALTEEFIPALEARYRAIAKPSARFVGGHSSGGWSSLWLQVTYPDFFGGVWSTSPDPIDFTDFQVTNLYEPGANIFVNKDGSEHPLARQGDKPILFYRGFSDMERPIRGEQLGSFEAVFSRKGADGEPEKLWDRTTGAIQSKVANDWKRYDIGLILRTNWKRLGPKLKGKLHVYTGDMDTFYLEGPVRKVGAELKALGSDAKFEIFPGDHFTVMTKQLQNRIDREMAEQFKRGLGDKSK